MKKKIITLFLAGTMAISLIACGGSDSQGSSDSSAQEQEEEPTDLTGTWQSENNNGSYQEAVITEDSISINWVTDNGDTTSIYWVGTYVPPTEAVDEYSWTSERDTEATDNALLASQDDTKDFEYKDSVISYEVSAMGTTEKLELTKIE